MVEDGEAVDAAIAIATRIAANGPLGLVAAKQIVTEGADWTAAERWDKQAAIVEPVFASQDAREGAMAFAERRQPVWRGL